MKFPIEGIIKIKDNDTFQARIEDLKNLKNYQVDFNLFYNVILNLRNGCSVNSRPNEWNTFTLEEWCEFLNKHKIEIKPNQIDLIFNYLTYYHMGIITLETNNKFRANFNYHNSDENYVFEMIALNM